MEQPSFFKRLIDTVVHPGERARAARRARAAIEFCHALLSARGEVSGAQLAREALAAFGSLSQAAREIYFDLLVSEFSPDPRSVLEACEAYRADPASQERLLRLQRAVEPPRQELFRRINMAPGGTTALVTMRRHVLEGLSAHPDWKAIDADLVHLFGSWFNRGFLTLQRIDWHTSAIVLEKLIRYEAVHEITGWNDLRRRLEADRRCFAFFHPALPDEPLIFIEVALTKGIPTTVRPLLDLASPVTDPATADTATFYSITSCQEGLRGISFGNLLIKQVVQQLGQEFPRLRNFATLSPVPGFRSWLRAIAPRLAAAPRGAALAELLREIERPDWPSDAALAPKLHDALGPLCAYYLLHARRNGELWDPVARFHLGNGARLERLNWLADTSTRGLEQSAGLMVNYVYRLEEVEDNHEIYVKEQRVVASHQLRRLARECPLYAGTEEKQPEP